MITTLRCRRSNKKGSNEQNSRHCVWQTDINDQRSPILMMREWEWVPLTSPCPDYIRLPHAFTDLHQSLQGCFTRSFYLLTDLDKIVYRQPSDKFDMPELPVNYQLQEDDIAKRVIKTSRQLLKNLSPVNTKKTVAVVNYPFIR